MPASFTVKRSFLDFRRRLSSSPERSSLVSSNSFLLGLQRREESGSEMPLTNNLGTFTLSIVSKTLEDCFLERQSRKRPALRWRIRLRRCIMGEKFRDSKRDFWKLIEWMGRKKQPIFQIKIFAYLQAWRFSFSELVARFNNN